MCIVQLHSSSKPTSEIDFSVPARIVITADEKHKRIDVSNSQRRAPVSQQPSFLIRAQRRNTMAPGGPERASYLYVSSRGAAYHRCNEKFFYGRDSGEPLLLSDSDSDASSTKSATRTVYDATRRATHRDS